MKSNIDLTSNEMFSGQSPQDAIYKLLRRHVYGKFPWSLAFCKRCTSDKDLGYEFEGIKTGNRATRNSKKLCDEELSDDYCLRCGRPFTKTPWEKSDGVCRKCNEEMDHRIASKKPWRFNKSNVPHLPNPLKW